MNDLSSAFSYLNNKWNDLSSAFSYLLEERMHDLTRAFSYWRMNEWFVKSFKSLYLKNEWMKIIHSLVHFVSTIWSQMTNGWGEIRHAVLQCRTMGKVGNVWLFSKLPLSGKLRTTEGEQAWVDPLYLRCTIHSFLETFWLWPVPAHLRWEIGEFYSVKVFKVT